MSGPSDRAHIGRRLSRWRRLVLAFGPPAAKTVALALAEFAWTDQDDDDGELVARHCSQRILCRLCDYRSARGLRVRLDALESAGWIERDQCQTGPGLLREYWLLIPESVPADAIREFDKPSAGMWGRVFDAKDAISGEMEFPCSDRANDAPDRKQGKSHARKSGSGEIPSTNRGNLAHDQGNWSSPLKESYSSLQGALRKEEGGAPCSGAPLAGPVAEKGKRETRRKTSGPRHVSEIAPSEHDGPVPLADLSDYQRRTIRNLSGMGIDLDQIAKIARIAPETVTAILAEAAA